MNVSLVSLSLSHFSHSPFFSHSPLFAKHQLSIHNSKFKKFFSSAVYETGSFFKYSLTSSVFERFLKTAVFIDTTEVIDSAETNETYFFTDSTDLVVKDSTFMFCITENTSSAIFCNGKRPNCRLEVLSSRFIICASGSFGAILFDGDDVAIKDSCFTICISVYRYQAFFLATKKEYSLVERCHKDRCSPNMPIGMTHAEHMRGPNCSEIDCNHTRCFVKEKRALASFGTNTYLRYQRNVCVNCSGASFFGFNLDKTSQHYITDCILYHCVSKNFPKGMIETNGPIVFQRFIFYNTKMLFYVVDDQDARSTKESVALFIDCVTDTSKEYLTTQGKNISLVNLSFVPKRTYDMDIDFAEWKCKTPIPPTPGPSQTPTVGPTPKDTPKPTMSMYVVEMRPQPDQEPEMVDLYKNEEKLLTKADIIQIVGLAVLAIITAVIFFLAHKKKNTPLIAEEEKESLLQY